MMTVVHIGHRGCELILRDFPSFQYSHRKSPDITFTIRKISEQLDAFQEKLQLEIINP